MSLLDRLADAHIEAAEQRGEFDGLPGAGKPLAPDDMCHVPAALRPGYRLLRNAGFLPPEIQAQRELRRIEDLLAQAAPQSQEATQLARRLRWLELQLAESRRGSALLNSRNYSSQVRKRLAKRTRTP